MSGRAVMDRLDHISNLFMELRAQASVIASAADAMVKSLRHGGKIMLCGNGGSAADCQHIAAELMGWFEVKSRMPLAAIALTTDTSVLTAISNDLGYKWVFFRQVLALANAGDVLLCLSTSGNSENILQATVAARARSAKIIALTGEDGGKLAFLADICIKAPSPITARVQEMHIAIGHLMCEEIERSLC